MALNEGHRILKLLPDELEDLVKKWLAQEKQAYVDFERLSGSGDQGIDAIGFLSPLKFLGQWDNFQCKQLSKPLDVGEFFSEIGKVFYYASKNKFSPPRRYIFVAPRGFSSTVKEFVLKPTTIQSTLLAEWSIRCAGKIIKNQILPLDQALIDVITAYKFEAIEVWNAHKFVEQHNVRKILHHHIDVNPGKAPAGKVPQTVAASERPYVEQLLSLYGKDANCNFSSPDKLSQSPTHARDLKDQRRRYYDADAFHHHFRDNIDKETLDQFSQDIYDSVIDSYHLHDGMKRLRVVMAIAAAASTSGVFEKHKCAPNSVKQGFCHLMANAGDISWN